MHATGMASGMQGRANQDERYHAASLFWCPFRHQCSFCIVLTALFQCLFSVCRNPSRRQAIPGFPGAGWSPWLLPYFDHGTILVGSILHTGDVGQTMFELGINKDCAVVFRGDNHDVVSAAAPHHSAVCDACICICQCVCMYASEVRYPVAIFPLSVTAPVCECMCEYMYA